MHDVVIQPLLSGLSMGLFCGMTCMPFIAPYLVAEERGLRDNAVVMLQFLLGRFIGYAAFGFALGRLGESSAGRFLGNVSLVATALLAATLFLHSAGLIKRTWSGCGIANARRRTPLLMGLLMGMNACPPFLMSATYVFALHSAFKGLVYFVLFFMATTLYFLPLVFVGGLGRMREFRVVARVSGLLVGAIFMVYAIVALSKGGSACL